jgi:hypothetical protein
MRGGESKQAALILCAPAFRPQEAASARLKENRGKKFAPTPSTIGAGARRDHGGTQSRRQRRQTAISCASKQWCACQHFVIVRGRKIARALFGTRAR